VRKRAVKQQRAQAGEELEVAIRGAARQKVQLGDGRQGPFSLNVFGK